MRRNSCGVYEGCLLGLGNSLPVYSRCWGEGGRVLVLVLVLVLVRFGWLRDDDGNTKENAWNAKFHDQLRTSGRDYKREGFQGMSRYEPRS